MKLLTRSRCPLSVPEKKITKVLFCKIAHMKYYKGIEEYNDTPFSTDSYVIETGHCGEEYNFKTFENDNGEEICTGFVEHGGRQLRIENIESYNKKHDITDNDVLVVWFSRPKRNSRFRIYGWYNNAAVYRYHDEDYCYFSAKAEDCTLLPEDARADWEIPKNFILFRENHVKYVNIPELESYAKEITKRIEN
ncbi:MAG: hypothetical protein K2O36_00610 [Ruminococcus sp.]|nr:hypothetical protein [Ruminococcus sp.]